MAPNPIINLIPIVLVFFVMYFLLIRPQTKQQKAQAKMQAALKKNDEVVTMGGIHGTVVNVKEDVVTLRVDDNTRIDVDKTAISRRVKEG
jgi:preprotein translocase subunit YajC